MRVVLPMMLLIACKDADSRPPTPCSCPPPIVLAPAPPPPPPPSTTAWSRAEADPTQGNWDAAAEALTTDLAHCTSDCLALARREVTARMKALGQTTYSAPEGDDP